MAGCTRSFAGVRREYKSTLLAHSSVRRRSPKFALTAVKLLSSQGSGSSPFWGAPPVHDRSADRKIERLPRGALADETATFEMPTPLERHKLTPAIRLLPELFSLAGLLLSRFPGLRGQAHGRPWRCPRNRRTLVRSLATRSCQYDDRSLGPPIPTVGWPRGPCQCSGKARRSQTATCSARLPREMATYWPRRH
jgi:hypothetical protein